MQDIGLIVGGALQIHQLQLQTNTHTGRANNSCNNTLVLQSPSCEASMLVTLDVLHLIMPHHWKVCNCSY